MSYKATKPGLVFVLYLSMRYNNGIVVYLGPFLCIFSFHCYVCCLLVVLVKLLVLPSDSLERLVCVPILLCFPGQLSHLPYSSWR